MQKSDLPADLQAGVTRFYTSPTAAVWVIGRILVRDAADAADARRLQDGISIKQVHTRDAGGVGI